MDQYQLEIMALASLTALSCVLPGVFLVLRRVSLMSDAISHAILFGIVIAFFLTENLSSPWLVVGAALTGLLTVSLTELVIQTQKLKKDAAIGLVFPLLFSLGVILLTRYAGQVHLDTQCVLFGEIAFSPFNRLIINDHDFGPQSLWVMGSIFLLNLSLLMLFYKELKISTFDAGLAASLGFSPVLINYALMTSVSVTAVGAFESVGSILVVALMIAPPATAYLLTNKLSLMLIYSGVIGLLSAIGGYGLAYVLDANIAGSMATMSGIFFFLVLIFAPEQGLLAKSIVRKYRKWDFAAETLSVHLFHSENTDECETESIVGHMYEHMLWSKEYTSEAIAQALKEGLIFKEGKSLRLTTYGREKVKNLIVR